MDNDFHSSMDRWERMTTEITYMNVQFTNFQHVMFGCLLHYCIMKGFIFTRMIYQRYLYDIQSFIYKYKSPEIINSELFQCVKRRRKSRHGEECHQVAGVGDAQHPGGQ